MNPCSTTSPYRIDCTFLEECHSSKERKRSILHTLVPRRSARSMQNTHPRHVSHARLNLGEEGSVHPCPRTATCSVHGAVAKRHVGFHPNELQTTCVNADRQITKSARAQCSHSQITQIISKQEIQSEHRHEYTCHIQECRNTVPATILLITKRACAHVHIHV